MMTININTCVSSSKCDDSISPEKAELRILFTIQLIMQIIAKRLIAQFQSKCERKAFVAQFHLNFDGDYLV